MIGLHSNIAIAPRARPIRPPVASCLRPAGAGAVLRMTPGAQGPLSEQRNPDRLQAADPFLEAVRSPSGRVDVLGAALALVLDARPEADVEALRATCEGWGRRVSRRIAHAGARSDALAGTLLLTRFLFEEQGFSGDSETPHDPANCELDLVFERRLGLPITLGLLMVEVGKRAGLPLSGINFPGRFLVGLAGGPRLMLFDPFRGGRLVLPEDCQGLLDSVQGGRLKLRREFLRPCAPERFVERLLNNLKRAYLRRSDPHSAIRVQGRVVDLRPGDVGPLQERARLAFQVGRHEDALRDLQKAVVMAGEEPQGRVVRRQLEQVRRWIAAMR
jgi:regulator of sirC expression with transglutaminase-like and TPR domain